MLVHCTLLRRMVGYLSVASAGFLQAERRQCSVASVLVLLRQLWSVALQLRCVFPDRCRTP